MEHNEQKTAKPHKRTTRRKAAPKADPGDSFTYEKSYGEEMSEQETDALAMMIASYICEELRNNSRNVLQAVFPSFNPLRDDSTPTGKIAPFCDEYSIRSKFLPKGANPQSGLSEIKFTVSNRKKELPNE